MKDKITNQINVQVKSDSFIDEGDGVVSFPNGLTITDDSRQRNGTRYDIDSMDISKYGGQLTGDHEDKLSSLIGEAIGVIKNEGRVSIQKIRYAIKENPYAQLAYDLLIGGFSKNFSIETIGMPTDTEGVWWDSELVGLSQVVTQNNYNARLNKLVHNSLERSKQNGLNVEGIEEKMIIPESEKETQTQIETTEPELENKTIEYKVEVDTTEIENAIELAEKLNGLLENNNKQENKMEDPKIETPVVETPVVETPVVEEPKTEAPIVEAPVTEVPVIDENALADIVKNALAPLQAELEAIKTEQKNAFDKSVEEPKFKKEENKNTMQKTENQYADMDFETRYQEQINAAWSAVKLNDVNAWTKLNAINAVNLDALKEAGIARNSMTIEDLGNFVIAPEMYNQIVGTRNDYTAILGVTEWRETNSLEFTWLKRVGDIDMKNVAMCDDGADGNLKPISEYSTTPMKSELEELAAVTVVCTAATRFGAVDLLADAAQGYRTDYDRKRAQLVIAKLEQAVDATGNSVAYDQSTDTKSLVSWLAAINEITDTTLNGTLVFNAKTFGELKRAALEAGISGPLAEILTGGASIPTIFGTPFVVVPNDLMPTLGGTDSVVVAVDGENITINHAVFYADLTTFTGRTSGGLQYDVSSQASYESNGVTKSAYQRNELVLRGSFFRGGAIKDNSRVSGIRQTTIS